MHETMLIKQAQQGDARAFEELLELHYDSLFSIAYKWSGRREDAEDISQLACIKLAKSIEQFRFDAAFTTWLYRLVINCAKDWYRSQKRHTDNKIDIDQYTNIGSYRSKIDRQIFVMQILAKLSTFPDGYKETVLLVHMEGLSHSEAAEILGVKERTVSWRIHEVRKRLKLMFDREMVYE